MANQIRYQVGFDIQQGSLNQLKSSLQELQKMKISDIMKINDMDSTSAVKTLVQIKEEALNVEKALKEAFNSKLNTTNLETFNQSLKKSGTSIEQIYSTFSKAGVQGENAFRNITSQVLKTNIQLKESYNTLDKIATTLANTAKWNLASGAINSVSRSIEQAWGYTKALDASLNDIRIVTGKSADEMANFAVQANETAQALGKSTTDYTKAALIYAQQGLNDQEIEARAKITLKAANVTGQSTDDVSEQLTAVWNGYKVNAEEAELYVDRLAAVAATTASDLEELSTGMSKVASAASAMGVGEDQLAAQLSTIISVTKQAPESVGTALRTVYARISDIKAGLDEDGVTLGRYSGKMAELGINVLDMNGNLRDMGKVMEEIGGKWDTLTREQQVYLAQTMAGQRQYNNLLALFDNFEEYNKALATAQNAAGTLQEQQDIYMESTKAHLEQLKAAIENIYDSLLDTDDINSLIDIISGSANVIANFVDGIGGGANALKSLGSIGLFVFSEQISKGINTFILNIQRAQSNVQEIKSKIAEIQAMKDIPGLNDFTQELLNSKEKLIELARYMSPEQFSGMQELLDKIKDTGNELDLLDQKAKELDDFVTASQDIGHAWTSVDEVMQQVGNTAKDKVLKYYQDLKHEYKEISINLNVYKKALEDTDAASIKLTKNRQVKKLKQDYEQAAEAAKKYAIALQDAVDLGKFEDQPKLQNRIKNLNQQLEDIDFSKMAPIDINTKLKSIIDSLEGVARAAETNASKAESALDSAFYGAGESARQQVEETKANLQQLQEDYNNALSNIGRAISIDQVVKLGGAISMVASGVSQLSNLGKIDSDGWEKFLQIITNLATSLPMLLKGFKEIYGVTSTLSEAIKKLQKAETALNVAETAGITAKKASAAASGVKAGAETADAAATNVATKATNRFTAALVANPIFAAIAAITLLTTAFGIFTNAIKQNTEEKIKNNKTVIDDQNKKQEQIEKNRELFQSIEELNQKYKSGEITRGDLKSSIDDLIEKYDVEDKKILKLIQDYDNLGESIKKATLEEVEKGAQSAEVEYQSAADNLLMTATQGKGYKSGNKYMGTFSFGLSTSDEDSRIKNILKTTGGMLEDKNRYGENLFFETDYDEQSISALVTRLQKAKEEIELTVPAAERNSSEYYKDLVKYLEKMKEASEAFSEANKGLLKYKTELLDIDQKNGVNFESTKDLVDYSQKKEAMIQGVKRILEEKGDTTTNAAELVSTYLKKSYKDLYNSFEQVDEYTAKLKEKFGHGSDLVEKLIGQLNESQFAALANIPPEELSSWGQLKEICENLSKIDFSNFKDINSDITETMASAADAYNFYQDLEDKIKNSKGKNVISKSEYDQIVEINPDLAENFFEKLNKSTYKMTGDIEEFYNTVNNLKIDGFLQSWNAIEDKINTLQNIDSNNVKDFNYNEISKSAYTEDKINNLAKPQFNADTKIFEYNPDKEAQTSINVDYDLVKNQLDYLKAVTDSNDALQEHIKVWEKCVEKQNLSKDSLDAIADEVSKAGDLTKGTGEKLDELREKSREVEKALHDAMFPTDSDVNLETLNALSKTLQGLANESKELDDNLEENKDTAEDVAESILRFDDACQDVAKSYKDWMAALKSGSLQDVAEVIPDLRDAYSDLLDLDGSSLSNDFLTSADNLNLMKAAIDGDIEAYNKLLELAGQDILIGLGLNDEEALIKFQNDLAWIQSYDFGVAGNIADLAIGAELNDQPFLDELTNIVNAASMTAKQATDYLSSMGVDAEIIETKTPTTETKQITGFEPIGTTTQIPYDFPYMSGLEVASARGYMIAPGVNYKPLTEEVVDVKESSATSLKVTSAHKSTGGGFKFKQASNGGGSKGTTRRSSGSGGKKGGSGSGKKGGSGSKAKAAEPDTSQKDRKKSLEDERDIYHDINIEIEQINRNLDRTQKQQDRLYGKELINNLNKQTKILEQQNKKLQEKQKIQKQDLTNQQKTLKNLGVTFDAYGNILNYMSILASKQAEINAKTLQYNQLIDQYNASTNKDTKKQIADQAEAVDKQIKELEDNYKELESKIKDYDSLREDMEDLVDEMDDILQQEIEINIKKFRMEVELRLEMGEAERDWNEFQRKVLNKSDIIKDTEFDKTLKDTAKDLNDLYSYFNVRGSIGSIQMLTDQLMATRAEIEAIDKTGNSAIYGDNKAQAMEDLQNDLDELMSQMEDIEDIIDSIDEKYLDTIDDINDQLNKQIEDYEFIGDLLEHDMDLLSLLYGDKNYNAMDKYYNALNQNNMKQLDSLKKQADYWKERWQLAALEGDTQAAKQFEENYKNTIDNLNSLIEESAQNLQDKYINSINQIFDTLDKKISNGKGTDYLSTEWELMNKNADEYLDTINAAFAIQETERKYQKALNETKSIKNQQILKNLMDEQLENLKTKEKLTEYDIQRAEKLLAVEQARIALEESQSSKTSMRLKRNSQGNYTYEYVADDAKVEDARSALASAQNDLYNFDKEHYQANLNDILAAWRDFQEQYKEIVSDASMAEEEKVEKLALLREEYGEYINNKTAENLVIRNNLTESAFADLAALYETDVENYNQMSQAEQDILMNDLIPAWSSGIQEMTDTVAGEGGFIPTCQDAFEDITYATEDYKNELQDLANVAGMSLNDVKNGVDQLSWELQGLIENNDDLILRMNQEMDAIAQLRIQAKSLADEYKNVYDAAKLAVSGIHGYIQAQQSQAAAEAAAANGRASGNTSTNNNTSKNNSSSNGSNSSGSKGGVGRTADATTVEGIAGNIWVWGTWGNDDPDRHNNLLKKFGKDEGEKMYKAIQAKFNSGYGYNGGLEHDWDYYKKYSMSNFRSGGYTGNWSGVDGKLGILHQKELILNASDTENLLNTVNILRSITSSLGSTISAKVGSIKNRFSSVLNNETEHLEQLVNINANFPNVNSKQEIEEAFNELVNMAAQRTMRRK